MSRARLLALTMTLATALLVSACSKKPPVAAPEPPPPPPSTTPTTPPPPPPPPAPAPAPAPKPLTDDEVFARKSLEDLNAEKPLEDVFFAFDSSELSDMARTALQKNAEWMKRWSSTRITIEGHCDSRGTPEYNIGLGDRRAQIVASYLTSLGIPTARVLTVSKGEEDPFCAEDSEACWSQNRRGHFVITAK
jgi:peptidoglycan-associated lipoprotein